ncbi:MAG: hypothetical protein ACR2H4_12815 [Pyrinomonadaceae bacterium]
MNPPDQISCHYFLINNVPIAFRRADAESASFLLNILEPWSSRGRTQGLDKQEWDICAWTSAEQVERLCDQLSGVPRLPVKRWRGDDYHQMVSDAAGNVAVLHTSPFVGVTLYCGVDRRIYCVFRDGLDIPHCEHTVKYPGRTGGRREGRFDCHASCGVFGDTAIVFIGQRRCGKTTLALEAIFSGANYVSNDLCVLELGQKEITVHALPHMLRLTDENARRWPTIARRTFDLDRANEDYSKGFVFNGGKYEAYAPAIPEILPSIVGNIPYPVRAVVFPSATVHRRGCAVRILSAEETLDRTVEQIALDRPLPDWLPAGSVLVASVSQFINEGPTGNSSLFGIDFSFSFEDRGAFKTLFDALATLGVRI